MTHIRCSPDGADVPVAADQTLLEALVAAGVPIAHACGGKARCSTCRVRVEGGADLCAPRPADEEAMAARLGLDDQTRLACRTRVRGDVTVRRLVIDTLDERLASLLNHGPAAVGREADVAILFADIAGFTPLAEALPAYDVVHLLDRWFAVAGPVVERWSGRIDNYMGDGLMAVFGGAAAAAPGSETPQAVAEGSVHAALALVDAAAGIDRYAHDVYGRSFAVRVGIHCGTVVVGTLGAAHNRRETAIGDVVNIAARLEAANKELGSTVLVSDAVASRLGPAFRLGRSADLPLKGKAGTHSVREVLGAD